MQEKHVIILGAGICGLHAAVCLCEAGAGVTILEAQPRTGGRIHTLTNFASTPVEAGAEFIHHGSKMTESYLKAGGLKTSDITGAFFQLEDGKISESDFGNSDWEKMLDKLREVKHDDTLTNFLHKHFPTPRYEDLHRMAKKFVEGFDAADPARISILALKEEWLNQDEDEDVRLRGGYCELVRLLMNKLEGRASIKLNHAARAVEWTRGKVKITCSNESVFEGTHLLCTVPISILQRKLIDFTPAITAHEEAAGRIGFGGVIKFLFDIDGEFWRNVIDKRFPDFRFIFSDAPIPTWWSQAPARSTILTGWLAGPSAEKIDKSLTNRYQEAIASLAYIFAESPAAVRAAIRKHHIADWTSEPCIRGAYSYALVDSAEAKKVLNTPIDDCIFFAGEALYSGALMGTVEAAICSADETAKLLLTQLKSD